MEAPYVARCREPAGVARAHGVGKPGLFVNDDVVRAGDACVERISVERHGRSRGCAEAGQVKDLHAMIEGLADDEGMVRVGLDVPPARRTGCGGELAEVDGRCWSGHVYEGRSIRQTDERVLASGLGIGPAPDVIGCTWGGGLERGEHRPCEVGLEMDAIARKGSSHACDTLRSGNLQLAPAERDLEAVEVRFQQSADLLCHIGHRDLDLVLEATTLIGDFARAIIDQNDGERSIVLGKKRLQDLAAGSLGR